MKKVSNQKAVSILSSVRATAESHSEALKQLSEKALRSIDNAQALDSIEREAIRHQGYKRGSSALISLMSSDKDTRNVAASLLTDAKRDLRSKDYAKFIKLVDSLQHGAKRFDAGLARFAREFLSCSSFESGRVQRAAFETHAAKRGVAYKNNVSSGERLLCALGLHDVESEGNRIVSLIVTDAEGYAKLKELIG